jgi:hypothetical protein
LDAFENSKAQEYNCTHGDPPRGDLQYHGSPDQTADQYQEADNVNPE